MAHFQLQFREFQHVTISGQLCWQVHDSTPEHISQYIQTFILHTKAHYIVHTNIHFAYQSVLHTNIHFVHQGILHST